MVDSLLKYLSINETDYEYKKLGYGSPSEK